MARAILINSKNRTPGVLTDKSSEKYLSDKILKQTQRFEYAIATEREVKVRSYLSYRKRSNYEND
jgi:hypothetical protein